MAIRKMNEWQVMLSACLVFNDTCNILMECEERAKEEGVVCCCAVNHEAWQVGKVHPVMIHEDTQIERELRILRKTVNRHMILFSTGLYS